MNFGGRIGACGSIHFHFTAFESLAGLRVGGLDLS